MNLHQIHNYLLRLSPWLSHTVQDLRKRIEINSKAIDAIFKIQGDIVDFLKSSRGFDEERMASLSANLETLKISMKKSGSQLDELNSVVEGLVGFAAEVEKTVETSQ